MVSNPRKSFTFTIWNPCSHCLIVMSVNFGSNIGIQIFPVPAVFLYHWRFVSLSSNCSKYHGSHDADGNNVAVCRLLHRFVAYFTYDVLLKFICWKTCNCCLPVWLFKLSLHLRTLSICKTVSQSLQFSIQKRQMVAGRSFFLQALCI